MLCKEVVKLKTEVFCANAASHLSADKSHKVKRLTMTHASYTCSNSSASLYTKQLILSDRWSCRSESHGRKYDGPQRTKLMALALALALPELGV